jgi:uncharacterized protein Yka (UPF0111/DUF47 family)
MKTIEKIHHLIRLSQALVNKYERLQMERVKKQLKKIKEEETQGNEQKIAEL